MLDDNCTLCLPNGERIKLNPVTMRMLFEVQDLAAASPATVSRCGMVYLAGLELGWRPAVQSWVEAALPKVRRGWRGWGALRHPPPSVTGAAVVQYHQSRKRRMHAIPPIHLDAYTL